MPNSNQNNHFVIILINYKTNSNILNKETEMVLKQFYNTRLLNNFEYSKYVYSYIVITKKTQNISKTLLSKLNLTSSYGLIKKTILETTKKLIAFDMDSTLVQLETLNEFAGSQNLKDKISKITEEAMLGKIDYNQSFKKRIELLKGIEESKIHDLANKVPLNDGAEELLNYLNKKNIYKTLISGGLTQFGFVLNSRFHFNSTHLNEIDLDSGKIKGTVSKEIVNTEKKAEILKTLIMNENIKFEEAVSVGDGANDVLMFRESGMSIAFNGKPKAKDAANICINNLGLDSVIPLLALGK